VPGEEEEEKVCLSLNSSRSFAMALSSLLPLKTYIFLFLVRVELEGVEDSVGEPVVLSFLIQVSRGEVRGKLLHVPHIPTPTQNCIVFCGVAPRHTL